GFQPWPGATTQFRGKSLKLIAGQLFSGGPALGPGELRWQAEKLLAGSGTGTTLELLQVQPEGKRAMSAREFVSGYRPGGGERLGKTAKRLERLKPRTVRWLQQPETP